MKVIYTFSNVYGYYDSKNVCFPIKKQNKNTTSAENNIYQLTFKVNFG